MIQGNFKPIVIPEPPRHTQIQPRCYTCSKEPVCEIKKDYFKTMYLIQNILGDPQEDREFCYKEAFGFHFDNLSKIFDNTIEVIPPSKDRTLIGTLCKGTYKDKDEIKVSYMVDGLEVLFNINWNEEENQYICSDGTEIFYGIIFKLKNTLDFTKLLEWRQAIIEEESEPIEQPEIINTTHFSVILNCEYYDFEKHKNEIPKQNLYFDDKDNLYCHIGTYHFAPKPVLEKWKYPFSTNCNCKVVSTRDDMSE